MKQKLIATLALALGVSVLSSCAGVISFPERATDPGVSLWQPPETEAPSAPRDLIGIWSSAGGNTVFRFGEGGVLTVWRLVTGYDDEYSDMATGSYTYDGQTLTMTLGGETVTRTCRVKDGTASFDGTVTMTLRTGEPTAHPTYPYPDFETLAAGLTALNAAALTGQTVSAPGKRLAATVLMKNTYFAGKEKEKLTDGTAKAGDMVNIDYAGKLNGVAFEGGTAQNTDVTVAPDTGYIPGFCEGIAGHTVGETFDVSVTFPETYGSAELAGKEVVFTMTLNAIYNTTLTDEMVAAYEGNSYTTAEAWENAIFRDLITDSIWELMPAFSDYTDTTDAYRFFYQDMLDFYHYYAAYYGMEFGQFLSRYVGKTVSQLEAESRSVVRNYLLAAAVVQALELTPEEAWLNDFTEGYLASYIKNGYTAEQARELIASGEGKNRFRAAMLLDLAADRLFTGNTFVG